MEAVAPKTNSHLKWPRRWWYAWQFWWPQNRRRCQFLQVGLNDCHLKRDRAILSHNAMPGDSSWRSSSSLVLLLHITKMEQAKTQMLGASSLAFLPVPLPFPRRCLLLFLEQPVLDKPRPFGPLSNKKTCHCLPRLMSIPSFPTDTGPASHKQEDSSLLCYPGFDLPGRKKHDCLLRSWTSYEGNPNLREHSETECLLPLQTPQPSTQRKHWDTTPRRVSPREP